MDERVKSIQNWLQAGSINIFGLPFAGKDTQGRRLAELLSAVFIAGGDILRHHKENQRLQRILASGNLIPSELYFDLVLPFLTQSEYDNKPLVLSSVGREKGEEHIIMKATNESNHPMKAVVFLRLEEHEVWRRFEASRTAHDRGGRTDDDHNVLSTRLEKFKTETIPVIEFYRKQGLVEDINGNQSRQMVANDIIGALAHRAVS